jgi:O-antigen ligase
MRLSRLAWARNSQFHAETHGSHPLRRSGSGEVIAGTGNAAFATRQATDPIALSLLIFSGLNINGAVLMFLGIQAMLSPLILLLVVILCARYVRPSGITSIYLLFVAFVGSYLGLATLIAAATSGVDWEQVSTYSATVLFVTALYFWFFSIGDARLDKALVTFKNILLLSCMFVVLSDAIRPYQAFRTFTETDRATGLFENPNEAAMAALYCLVLVAALPPKSTVMRLFQCALPAVALLMTFSKTGMLILIVLGTIYVVTRRSYLLSATVAAGIIASFWGVWLVFEQDLLSLSWEQRERLADVLNLIGGEFNTRSTTGRDILFDFGLEKIGQALPWGAGLGTFHAMEGSIRNALNEWLGIHNTFLMVLGEAGVIPFILFLSLVALLLLRGLNVRHPIILYGFTLILIGDMMTSHNILVLRIPDLALALAMALVASRPVSSVRARQSSGEVLGRVAAYQR